MLPIILVLLFASSALAATTVKLNLNSINEVDPLPSNGRLFGDSLATEVFDTIDGGEKNVNIQLLTKTVAEAANTSDSLSQARSLAQALAILIELSTGNPGDACLAANFIDASVNFIRSGNVRGACIAAASYVHSLVSGINSIVRFTLNPESARFASGRKGNCQADGAAYQFEAAWDLIRSDVEPSELLQEQYCSGKRLFNGFTAISRNVGAAATAAAQTHVAKIVRAAGPKVIGLLQALAYGSPQVAQAARSAQQALTTAANNYVK